MIAVDVNVLAYLLIRGEHTAAAESVHRKDSNGIAPSLWRSEFLNVLATYCRKKLLTIDKAAELFEEAEELLSGTAPALEPSEILKLSVDSGCSAYDCQYVLTARMLNVRLITTDAEVLRAFPELAISVTDFVS